MDSAGKRNLPPVDYKERWKPKRLKVEGADSKDTKEKSLRGRKKVLVTEEVYVGGTDRHGKHFIHLRDCRIFDNNETACLAMDLDQAVALVVVGRDCGNELLRSGALMEWFAYSERDDEEPLLGVADHYHNFILEDSAPEYQELFNRSRSIVLLGQVIKDELEIKANASLVDVLKTFYSSPQNTFSTKADLFDFVRERAKSLLSIMKAKEVLKRFPRAPCCRQLEKFVKFDERNYQRHRPSPSLSSGPPDCVGQLLEKFNPEEYTLNEDGLAWADNDAGLPLKNLHFECRPHIDVQWFSGESVKLAMASGEVKEISKGDSVRVGVKGGKTVLGQIQHLGPPGKNTVHLQRLCSSHQTLLGNFCDKKELFMLHECADVPLQAILDKVTVVFGSSHDSNYFCVYEACTEYGFFQDVQPSLDVGESCRCCEVDMQIGKFYTPTRIGETESFEFEGETYHCGSFMRLVRAPNDKYISIPVAYDKEWKTSQYRQKRPEMGRCRLTQRTRVVMKPQQVGQIVKTEFGSDGTVKVTLRLFQRAEDLPSTTLMNPHPNWLHSPKPGEYVEIRVGMDTVAGKAFVRFFEPNCDVDDWLLMGPHRFFVDELNVKLPDSLQDLRTEITCTYGLKQGDVNSLGFPVPPPGWLALPQEKKLKVFDVFCGAGGMAWGLEKSGLAIIEWGLDKDMQSIRAFSTNFPKAKPINKCVKDFFSMLQNGQTEKSHPSRGKVDILCGGPPCQGFSRLNRSRSSESSKDKRSGVITFLCLAEALDPKFILMENVQSLVQYGNGVFLQFMVQVLLRLGYQCRVDCLQAANFGVPQDRKRIILLGAKRGEELPEIPEATHCFIKTKDSLITLNSIAIESLSTERGAALRTVLAVDAIGDLPTEASHLESPSKDYPSPPTHPFQHEMRRGSRKLHGHTVPPLSELNKARIRLIPMNGNWWHLPNVRFELPDGTCTTILKYFKSEDGSGRRLVCPCHDEGGTCLNSLLKVKNKYSLVPYSTAHSATTKHRGSSNYARVETNWVFPTMVTTPSMSQTQGKIIHPTADRLLSVKERGRAQSLPDDFNVWGTIQDQTTQIGNAVPPPLAFHLGQAILKSLRKKP